MILGTEELLLLAFIIPGLYLGLVSCIRILTGLVADRQTKFVFASILVVLTARLAEYLLLRLGVIHTYPHLLFLSVPLTFLLAPLAFVYIKKLLLNTMADKKQLLGHGVVFLVGLIMMASFYMRPEGEKLEYLNRFRNGGELAIEHWCFIFLLVFQLLYYLFLFIRLIKTYNIQFKKTRSDGSLVQIWWIRVFLITTTTFVVMYLITNAALINQSGFFASVELVAFLLLSIILQVLGLLVIGNRIVFAETLQVVNEKYVTSNLKGMDFTPLLKELTGKMESEKLYLNPELRISHLAEILNVPIPHMSQIINEGTDSSFYDFVNSYRIEEAKRLILTEEYKRYKIIAVALDSGFGNKTTFNRTFKKHVGMTPTEFIRANQ